MHQPTTTPPYHNPHTHVADVEVAERCFHVSATSLEALSASNDVAKTWKRLSASSTSAPHLSNVPLPSTINPTNREAREVPEHEKVQGPHPWFLPFSPLHCSGVTWDRQRGCQHPLFRSYFGKKSNNHLSITRERFGASW